MYDQRRDMTLSYKASQFRFTRIRHHAGFLEALAEHAIYLRRAYAQNVVN